ncbi:MAG: ABC transporter permease [Planctomycetota bacterium]|nr:ABC transporter permease [Planctomycetota bacterium]MDW8373553.1 ABC transporter permease [Planctomycetota bacterium]
MLSVFGRALRDSGSYLWALSALLGHGLRRGLRPWRTLPAVGREVVKRQILFTGVEALPFTGLLAVLTGAAVAAQASVLSGNAGRELVGLLIVTALVRELGPLLVSFIVIGRSGAAIAAELAGMRVRREVDMLIAMGIDVFDYLILPRLIGVASALVGLTLAFLAMSLIAGWLILALVSANALALDDYAMMIAGQLSVRDAVMVAAKTVVAGLLIAAIACHEGFTAASSATDIPRATTRAVVRSLAAAFLWCTLISGLMYAI